MKIAVRRPCSTASENTKISVHKNLNWLSCQMDWEQFRLISIEKNFRWTKKPHSGFPWRRAWFRSTYKTPPKYLQRVYGSVCVSWRPQSPEEDNVPNFQILSMKSSYYCELKTPSETTTGDHSRVHDQVKPTKFPVLSNELIVNRSKTLFSVYSKGTVRFVTDR